MKTALLPLLLLTTPVYAHLNHQAAPQHSIEHLIIGVVLLVIGFAGYRLFRKNK